jgi:hypothetical protein
MLIMTSSRNACLLYVLLGRAVVWLPTAPCCVDFVEMAKDAAARQVRFAISLQHVRCV